MSCRVIVRPDFTSTANNTRSAKLPGRGRAELVVAVTSISGRSRAPSTRDAGGTAWCW